MMHAMWSNERSASFSNDMISGVSLLRGNTGLAAQLQPLAMMPPEDDPFVDPPAPAYQYQQPYAHAYPPHYHHNHNATYFYGPNTY